MKVVFINDSTSDPNWGDRAAASSMRQMIVEAGGEVVRAVSEDELFHLSVGRHSTPWAVDSEGGGRRALALFVPPIVLAVRRRVLSRVHGSGAFGTVPQAWEAFDKSADALLGKNSVWSDLLNDVQEADVAVIHGDGAMVGNGPHPRTLLFLSYVIKRRCRTPVIMVNHTADFDDARLLRMAENVYPSFDDVVYRDPISAERCASLCSGRFAPDTSFLFSPAPLGSWAPFAQRPGYFDVWPDTARFDPTEPYLCLGGSSAFGAVKDFGRIVQGYMTLVDGLRSRYSGQIVLTASDLIDQTILRPVAQRARLPLVGLTTPVQQAVDILGNADAYIGGRWHPSIFALRGGTPVLALSSKTFKMRALAEMTGSSATFNSLHLGEDSGAIVRQLASFLERGTELRDRLSSWAEQQAENSRDNVTYLTNFGSDATARKSTV
jgi:hypothetical protein